MNICNRCVGIFGIMVVATASATCALGRGVFLSGIMVSMIEVCARVRAFSVLFRP